MKIILRDYQKQAIEKIKWALTLKGNDIISLPTGAGKSIVIAELANYLDQDILILQPSKEILEQNKEKLSLYVDKEEIGVYSASLSEKIIKKYTFATIGSIYKIPEQFNHFKIVILDECHLLNPKDTGSMFSSFLKAIGVQKVIGFTATPYRIFPTYFREPNGTLYRTSAIKIISRVRPLFWDRILFNVNIADLLAGGYLCPIKYIDRTTINQEIIPLNKSNTDFDLDAYEKMIWARDKDIVELVKFASNKFKAVLVFCNSISQSERLNGYFENSEAVSSKSKPDERKRIINGFKDGSIKIVFNVGVLTTGFDMPSLDCIVLLRPTRSVALYYQMLGRGVRLCEGKTHCTVIDYSDSVKKIGRLETIKLDKVGGLWDIVTETQNWHGVELYRVEANKPEQQKLIK